MDKIIEALLIAFAFMLLGVDNLLIEGANEVMGTQITIAGYYFIFFIIGLVFDIFEYIERVKKRGV